ncbi:MAG: NAD-glutamate dehydrogenase, partial [Brevundimonas sp.]
MSAASRTASAGQANLEALLKAFSEVAAGPPGAVQTSLLEQVIEDYEADETPEVGLKDLAVLLNQAWQQSSKREAGSPAFVTVGPLNGFDGRATGYDQVLILQDDAPFLVDSVLGELADAGVTVRAFYHPVIEMEAGRRDSLIILIIDPLPQERRDVLGEGLASAMADVRLAVQDHGRMVEAMKSAIGRLEADTSERIDPAVREENIAFLRWVKSDHFVFLGARDYDFPVGTNGELQAEAPMSENESGMGILSDPERRVLRRASEPAVLTPAMKQQMDHSDPVTVAKSNLRSRVHRRAVMDYIGVKRYDA